MGLLGTSTLLVMDLVGPRRSCGCPSCKVGPRRSFGCWDLFHHYLLIALRRSSQYKAYKNQEVTSFSLRNSVPLPGISSPFYSLPFITTFYHENIISTESAFNTKIFCLRAHPHSAATERNLSSRECIK